MTKNFTSQECEAYAKHMMSKYLKQDWEFVWSDKMTNSFGLCCSNYKIKLSKKYFHLNSSFPVVIRNVILHEIAHAMQYEDMGYLSHDKHWKKYCLKIGAEPVRCFSRLDVTAPCAAFALRDTFTGKVIQYIQKRANVHITKFLQETNNYIKEVESSYDNPVSLELIWCG
jgi:hypothetical protein